MQGAKVYVGVDVGKSYLDVAWAKESHHFSNNERGHEQFVRWLGQRGEALQVIVEASGGYECELVRRLQRSGLRVSLVQASRVRQFARAPVRVRFF